MQRAGVLRYMLCHITQIVMQRASIDAIQIWSQARESIHGKSWITRFIYLVCVVVVAAVAAAIEQLNWKGRRGCDYVNFFAYDNGTGRPCARKFSFHNRRNYILTRSVRPGPCRDDLLDRSTCCCAGAALFLYQARGIR